MIIADGQLRSSPQCLQAELEPLSLDEAYLDVTENKLGMPTATLVAKTIRQQIREELSLTASADVARNKLLAKIASDWKKLNGQFVIQPHEVQAFLLPLPVGRIPGVGRSRRPAWPRSGLTVGDIYAMEMPTLEEHFGSYGSRLYELARGIDHNPGPQQLYRLVGVGLSNFQNDVEIVSPLFATDGDEASVASESTLLVEAGESLR